MGLIKAFTGAGGGVLADQDPLREATGRAQKRHKHKWGSHSAKPTANAKNARKLHGRLFGNPESPRKDDANRPFGSNPRRSMDNHRRRRQERGPMRRLDRISLPHLQRAIRPGGGTIQLVPRRSYTVQFLPQLRHPDIRPERLCRSSAKIRTAGSNGPERPVLLRIPHHQPKEKV